MDVYQWKWLSSSTEPQHLFAAVPGKGMKFVKNKFEEMDEEAFLGQAFYMRVAEPEVLPGSLKVVGFVGVLKLPCGSRRLPFTPIL